MKKIIAAILMTALSFCVSAQSIETEDRGLLTVVKVSGDVAGKLGEIGDAVRNMIGFRGGNCIHSHNSW